MSSPSRRATHLTVSLAALAFGMKLAHALELWPKLQWSAALYIAVQSTLYRVFAVAGPGFELGALALLVFRARAVAGAARGPARASVACVLLSLVAFVALVLPANGPLRAWAASGIAPEGWSGLRLRWQLGQTLGCLAHLGALNALAASMLREGAREG